jgi:hypothetical protein
MRLVGPSISVAALVAVTLIAMAVPVRAEDRSQLIACQTLIARATQAAEATNGTRPEQDVPELARCRQIVREWMLRDARMSVDERGQPLE